MNQGDNAYLDVIALTPLQTNQPVDVNHDHNGYYGYGYQVEIVGDLFVLRLADVACECQQCGPFQQTDPRLGYEASHRYPGEARRH